MNCIVKAERVRIQGIEHRSTFLYCIGLLLTLVGVLCAVVGIIYIVSWVTNPVSISAISDNWIRILTQSRYDITLIGIAAFCLGTLFKWRGEDLLASIETSNRPIKTLLTARSERR